MLYRHVLLCLMICAFNSSCTKVSILPEPAAQLNTSNNSIQAALRKPVQISDLQAAVNRTPVGGKLVLQAGRVYEVKNTIVLDKPIEIDGAGTSIIYTGKGGESVLAIQSGGVMLKNVKMGTNERSSYVPGSYLIATKGSSNRKFYEDITIHNCVLYNYGESAIYARYIRNFTFSDNSIRQLPYGGIIVFSGVDGVISGNTIANISGWGVRSGNAYGIAVSRQNGMRNDTVPRNILITGNTISNIKWEGIDTHGGEHFTVTNNRIINCGVGIAMVSAGSGNDKDESSKAPKKFKVIGNYIEMLDTAGKAAIRIDGQNTQKEMASGLVQGNVCVGQSIKVELSRDIVIRNNVIDRSSSGYGVLLNGCNQNAKVVGNLVKDVWLPRSNASAAIGFQKDHNVAYIDANRLKNSGFVVPRPAIKNAHGFRKSKGIGNRPSFGRNDFATASIAPIRL